MTNQVFSLEDLDKTIETLFAPLREDIADLVAKTTEAEERVAKEWETVAKEWEAIEDRLAKLETRPVIPPNLAFKIQERE
jgi:predicted  nucleic acid-binding Zn-ribbon protein